MREMIEESFNLLDGICDKNVAKTTLDEPIMMWHGRHISQTCGKVTIGDLDKMPLESMNSKYPHICLWNIGHIKGFSSPRK